MPISSYSLEKICPLGMFQLVCQFHLANQKQCKQIAVVILHVGQESQIVKIGRGKNVRFINGYHDLLALIGCFKQQPIKHFQQIHFLFFQALLASDLTDNFPQELYERESGICDEGHLVFFRLERVNNHTER